MRSFWRRPLVGWALLAVAAIAAAGAEERRLSEPPAVRTLVVVLDAVPFATAQEILAARRETDADEIFVGFQAPLPVISTFPSSTSVAMVGLLEPFELPQSPGYEARFFDWETKKARGGGAISFFRIDFAWRDFFDWSRKGVVRSAFGGLRPVATSGTRVEKAVKTFFRSDKDPYFVYLETTDLAAHMKGPDELERVFVRLDAALEKGRKAHPEVEFRTVVFSDHGVDGDGSHLRNVFPDVRAAIGEGDYRITRRLRKPSDVVLTPFGLVSSFEAYAAVEVVPDLAERLGSVEGVDLCVYRQGEAFFVQDEGGRARSERRAGPDGPEWRYVAETGDPLHYLPLVNDSPGARAGTDWLPDSEWLAATVDHHYPDALHRISHAFELVENPASILCSLAPGHMYGLRTTESLARLTGTRVRWTHGALFREATLGFLLTDDERFTNSSSLRFDRALVPLTESRGAGLQESAIEGLPQRSQDKMSQRR